jgi:hypothetical protein
MKFILWIVLAFICWPLALAVLILYPIIWVLLLPFRLIGITFEGLFAFLRALFMFPARLLVNLSRGGSRGD